MENAQGYKMESSAGIAIESDGLVDSFRADQLNVYVYESRPKMGDAAAAVVGGEIRGLIEARGRAVGIFASAPSQNEFLAALVEAPRVDWSRVVGFHLDEYLGMDDRAPHGTPFLPFQRRSSDRRIPLAACGALVRRRRPCWPR